MSRTTLTRTTAFTGAAVLALIASGCGGSGKSTTSVAAVNGKGQQIGNLSTPGTPKGEQTIHIVVLAKKGEKRAAMAFVPVYIDGHGPYPFAVDTGASTSLISRAIVKKLKLPEMGPETEVSGVDGSGKALSVRVDNWQAGKIALPPSIVTTLVHSEDEEQAAKSVEPQKQGKKVPVEGPVGLLGSDVLSRYGKVAVDYDKSLLILDPRVR
jgi:Aspartyl protease